MRREFVGSPDGWGTEEAWDGAEEQAEAGGMLGSGVRIGRHGVGDLEEP